MCKESKLFAKVRKSKQCNFNYMKANNEMNNRKYAWNKQRSHSSVKQNLNG